MGSVLDYFNKMNIAIELVLSFWFPSAYESYVYFGVI